MSTGDWIQAVIALVSLGAFLGLVYSLWSLNRATFASVYQGIAGQMHDIDKLFIETPELRPHFYGNEPLPHDKEERERLLAIAELIIDFADNFEAQSRILRRAGVQHERGYRAYFRDTYGSSPAIRDFWSKFGDGWYCEGLKKEFKEAKKQFEEAEGLKASTAVSASKSASADAAPA